MNALSPFPALKSDGPDWDAICQEVNAWRGACMHHFSVVEEAVTKTLLALSEAEGASSKVRLRHLIGQRFEDLEIAIGPEGPFAEIGKTAARALAQFRTNHEVFRSQLCHGVAKVAVIRDGSWMLVTRSLSIRMKLREEAVVVIDRKEAFARLESLKRDGHSLAAQLGQIRKNSRTSYSR